MPVLYDVLTRRADFAPPGTWTLVYALWVVASTLFLLHRRRRPTTMLAWLLAFWTVPILSALVYFLIGPRRLDEQSGLRQAARRRALEIVPTPAERLPEAFSDVPCAALARVPRSSGDTEPEPRRARSLELFTDGDTAYPAIERAIAAARETVHLEYYIWEPDTIGTRLRDALAARARAGVSVRVVVDAVGAKNCRGDFWAPLVATGADVRKFNPPHLLKPQPGKMNFRTHRKIVVVDGHVAFTGGINVSDADLGTDTPPWRNTHLRLDGAPALDLQSIFLEDWLYGLPVEAARCGRRERPKLLDDTSAGPPLPDDIERWFPDSPEADGPWVQIVDSGPDESTHDIRLLLFTAIATARERLWITTPYFVPDEAVQTALESAAARGVDVRIIIPAEGDSKLVDAAAKTYALDIARRGAALWFYGPRMNHSKTVVVDDAFAIVGTANLDNRSFRLNFEVVAAVFDEKFTNEVAAMFERDLAEACRLDPDVEKQELLPRLFANAARVLSPLL